MVENQVNLKILELMALFHYSVLTLTTNKVIVYNAPISKDGNGILWWDFHE